MVVYWSVPFGLGTTFTGRRDYFNVSPELRLIIKIVAFSEKLIDTEIEWWSPYCKRAGCTI